MKLRPGRLRTYAGYIVLLLCALIATWLIVNRQYVIDQITVWQYEPSSAVSSLAKKSDMSDRGVFLFYASQPVMDGTQTFNRYCQKTEPQSAILGCYDNFQIYIYDVRDERLDGIEEVTAVHEMLHAAWSRLGESEKSRIGALLEATYERLNDEDLDQRMDYYARTEPTERHNELHSILATEYKDISNELEQYYKQYFDDRTTVVDLYDQYASVFDELQDKGASLAAQLTRLGAEIDRRSTEYNSAVSDLNDDIKDFNRRADAGGFNSRAQFDAERASLVARSQSLDGQRKVINSKIKQYQSVRAELEKINSQAEALNKSINSSLAPTPSV